MKIVITLLLTFITTSALSFTELKGEKYLFYKEALPGITYKVTQKIPDPISDEPTNTELITAYDSNKRVLGYIREVNTTTGCDSACLPVIFTLFYQKDGNFLKVKSKEGLTKKNHVFFTEEDYQKLELMIVMNPEIFKKVSNPMEMVDALTGATKREYRGFVVKEAAYSTLRINLYNQQTLKEIKKVRKPSLK